MSAVVVLFLALGFPTGSLEILVDAIPGARTPRFRGKRLQIHLTYVPFHSGSVICAEPCQFPWAAGFGIHCLGF